MQWGYAYAIADGDPTYVIYPIPFPHALLNIEITTISTNLANPVSISNTTAPTLTQFRASVDGANKNFYWMAIGY